MTHYQIYDENWCEYTVDAFYNSEYHGGGNWKIDGTIENMICTFKNDITPYSNDVLQRAENKLANILIHDLPMILNYMNYSSLVVCVIPRAKRENYYRDNQKLFRYVVQWVINNKLNGFVDGTRYIIRHTDTATTHLAHNPMGNRGTGDMPYKGITKETCNIANVRGKNILLIDDLYTKTVGIDEDAIQALYDNGANKVLFYSVGKTVR